MILNRKMVKISKRSRAVQSESAFEQIESAFMETQPELPATGTLA